MTNWQYWIRFVSGRPYFRPVQIHLVCGCCVTRRTTVWADSCCVIAFRARPRRRCDQLVCHAHWYQICCIFLLSNNIAGLSFCANTGSKEKNWSWKDEKVDIILATARGASFKEAVTLKILSKSRGLRITATGQVLPRKTRKKNARSWQAERRKKKGAEQSTGPAWRKFQQRRGRLRLRASVAQYQRRNELETRRCFLLKQCLTWKRWSAQRSWLSSLLLILTNYLRCQRLSPGKNTTLLWNSWLDKMLEKNRIFFFNLKTTFQQPPKLWVSGLMSLKLRECALQ